MNGFAPILAEVGDKEPSLIEIWIVGLVVSCVVFFLCRWRRMAVWVRLPIAVFPGLMIIPELRDPYVGSAIVAELGSDYVWHAYFAALCPLVALVKGFELRCRTVEQRGKTFPRSQTMPMTNDNHK